MAKHQPHHTARFSSAGPCVSFSCGSPSIISRWESNTRYDCISKSSCGRGGYAESGRGGYAYCGDAEQTPFAGGPAQIQLGIDSDLATLRCQLALTKELAQAACLLTIVEQQREGLFKVALKLRALIAKIERDQHAEDGS